MQQEIFEFWGKGRSPKSNLNPLNNNKKRSKESIGTSPDYVGSVPNNIETQNKSKQKRLKIKVDKKSVHRDDGCVFFFFPRPRRQTCR